VADDVDCYVFKAQKGKRYIIEAHASEHLSPTDVYLTLKNDKGAQVQASNPAAAPRLDFTAPADGDYTVTVEHLHSWGGPDEVYRLTITPFTPDFALTLNADRFNVVAGATVSIPVFVTRTGYNGPIEASAVGVKGLTGTLTIPAGPPRPPNVPAGVLTLKAEEFGGLLTIPAGVPLGPVVFSLQGKATVEGKSVTHLAS